MEFCVGVFQHCCSLYSVCCRVISLFSVKPQTTSVMCLHVVESYSMLTANHLMCTSHVETVGLYILNIVRVR